MAENKGFTLLELLVVTIIVSILAALGIVQYRRNMPKAKASKSKNALSLISEAEKMYQVVYGQFYRVLVSETIDGEIGTGATGMNLAAVDNDTDFEYSVSVAGLISANNPATIGACDANTPITYNLADGVIIVPSCYK